MEKENYYQKNQETQKLNIYTSKAFYDGLGDEQKKVFRQYCLWSGKQDCWVSKGKAENCHYIKSQLSKLGFRDMGDAGEKISFEEQVKRERERAGQRAETAEQRAEKAEQKSDQLYNKAKNMASYIPLGQPIHIGHYSEKSDRNYRDKIHNTYGKAFQEADKAGYYQDKAATAKHTADGVKYANPKYLEKKISESEKHIRTCERRLTGQYNPGSPVVPVSEAAKAFYNGRIAEENDKLAYFKKCMKAADPTWTGETTRSAKKSRGNGIK